MICTLLHLRALFFSNRLLPSVPLLLPLLSPKEACQAVSLRLDSLLHSLLYFLPSVPVLHSLPSFLFFFSLLHRFIFLLKNVLFLPSFLPPVLSFCKSFFCLSFFCCTLWFCVCVCVSFLHFRYTSWNCRILVLF